MKFKSLSILLIIFVCLAEYVWYLETNREDGGNETVKEKKLIPLDPEDVQQLTLIRGDEPIVFFRKNDHWMITSPISAEARNEMVHGLLSLFDMEIIREISADESDAAKYGLDHPEIRLEIQYKTDAPSHTLLIGDNSPGSLGCYAKLKNQSRIVLLGILYKNDLNQKLQYFIKDASPR